MRAMAADVAEEELDFDALVARFELPLLQYATRIIGDRERARDVVQETFVQLQRAPREQVDTAPAKWLFTVCRNRALNVCRKERRMTFLDDAFLETREAAEPQAFDSIQQSEARVFLTRILATLPPRQQEVLQLKFQNDLSYQEIAEITNTSAGSVGVLIHTALKTLRTRYAAAATDFIPFPARTSS